MSVLIHQQTAFLEEQNIQEDHLELGSPDIEVIELENLNLNPLELNIDTEKNSPAEPLTLNIETTDTTSYSLNISEDSTSEAAANDSFAELNLEGPTFDLKVNSSVNDSLAPLSLETEETEKIELTIDDSYPPSEVEQTIEPNLATSTTTLSKHLDNEVDAEIKSHTLMDLTRRTRQPEDNVIVIDDIPDERLTNFIAQHTNSTSQHNHIDQSIANKEEKQLITQPPEKISKLAIAFGLASFALLSLIVFREPLSSLNSTLINAVIHSVNSVLPS